MRYGGFKYAIDSYKLLTEQLDSATQSERQSILIKRDQLGYMPPWMIQLEWPERQKLPTPCKELTLEEWMLLGMLSESSELESYYSGLNIPNEKEWFGGWACHIRVYSNYALVDAHIYFSSSKQPELGLGDIVKCNQYGSYVVRYFKLGCEHQWKLTLSRMCYREYVCTKCGQTHSEDSSD